MKIVYHPKYTEVYESDPAAKAGRMESILKDVSPHFELALPEPADATDVALVHSDLHIAYIQRSAQLYEAALLAVGGAITAAELAISGEPAFGLIRPPGHHANPDHCWGFCFFNNIAISIARLRKEGKISTAVILDIDLHFGDGTDSIFNSVSEVTYFHPESSGRLEFVNSISRFLETQKADVIAVSAGFDRHEEDWGRLLKTEDYLEIGKLVKGFAESNCSGRRYGVLEGGYNHSVLGRNVKAFVEGMS